tara:strand:+ start:9 stop:293 length:285 start_codon:yes stop_codon:yes gene_type:complete
MSFHVIFVLVMNQNALVFTILNLPGFLILMFYIYSHLKFNGKSLRKREPVVMPTFQEVEVATLFLLSVDTTTCCMVESKIPRTETSGQTVMFTL